MSNVHTELDTFGLLEYLERHKNKSLLRVLACGSVDDGKSTLIGRLLHDSFQLYDDQLDALRKDHKGKNASGELELAMLVDGLQAEREQGITIDVAYRYFSTTVRKFILVDSPGHEQYTRNMVTGASHADIAILLVDARYGVQVQTRRHATICSLMGITELAVAVNKMDILDWDVGRFLEIQAAVKDLAESVGITRVSVFPISALKGDNVVTSSAKTPWYAGPALLPFLETVTTHDLFGQQTRFPVQYVNRPNLDYRGFSGTLASGTLTVGQAVTVYPSGRQSVIHALDTFDQKLNRAEAGDAITVVLADEVDVSRGDWIVPSTQPIQLVSKLDAHIVWFDSQELKLGHTYEIKVAARKVSGRILWINYRTDVNTGEQQIALSLMMNDIANITLELDEAIMIDIYREHPETGTFIVIDRLSNATVAAGMVVVTHPLNAENPLNQHHEVAKITDYERALNQLIRQKFPHWNALDVSQFVGEDI